MKLFDRIRLKGRSDKPSIVADSMVSDRWLSTTVTKAGNYTINPDTRQEDHSGRIYVSAQSSGEVKFILPTPTPALNGYHYKFVALTNSYLKVGCASAKIVSHNSTTRNWVGIGQPGEVIGGEFVAWCNGTHWFVTLRGESKALGYTTSAG